MIKLDEKFENTRPLDRKEFYQMFIYSFDSIVLK